MVVTTYNFSSKSIGVRSDRIKMRYDGHKIETWNSKTEQWETRKVMALRERSLWKKLKAELDQRKFLAYRIESSVTPGFPDVIIIDKLTSDIYFIELKAWKHKAHIPMYGALTTSQRNWHTDARTFGLNNFVLGIDGNDHMYFGQPDVFSKTNWTRVYNIDQIPTILRLRSE